ncbi:MAG: aminotransferase class I/II-fold pyridoxal phosphate-dependent enzyme [SAR202 cluster bacterium]|nr:aminotransferase class I/II-fold pyridoxal phosphate-dependent enzyme [SAR202 cluster bacterium]
MRTVDLRSDTKSLPSPEMRRAIAKAELGDDDSGEDPTVNRLEAMAAKMLGKEAALLVSSGTQGNLVSILAETNRGDHILLGDQTHIYLGEGGGVAQIAGVSLYPLKNTDDGLFSLDEMKATLHAGEYGWPKATLVCIENTQNLVGGKVVTPEMMRQAGEIARSYNLPVHLDGARLFNAAVYLRVPVAELVKDVDSVTFCLSKGLACPVGSIVCGSKKMVDEARKWRKLLGSSMRQAGIIAAAGVVALEHMVDRLAEDHQNAYRLARGLASIPGVEIDPEGVQTNLVFCKIAGAPGNELSQRFAERGVKFYHMGQQRFRLVTYYGITSEDIDYALEGIEAVVRKQGR